MDPRVRAQGVSRDTWRPLGSELLPGRQGLRAPGVCPGLSARPPGQCFHRSPSPPRTWIFCSDGVTSPSPSPRKETSASGQSGQPCEEEREEVYSWRQGGGRGAGPGGVKQVPFTRGYKKGHKERREERNRSKSPEGSKHFLRPKGRAIR